MSAAGSGLPRVVIAGGGAAGLEAAIALGTLAPGAAAVELVAPKRDFVYRPTTVTEPFSGGRSARFDLAALARDAGATYRCDAVAGIDAERRLAITRRGERLAYDYLLLAPGATSRAAIPGATTFWGLRDAELIRNLVASLLAAPSRAGFVIPPGPVWQLPAYELALLTSRRLEGSGSASELFLITPEDRPLALFGLKASEAVERLLRSRGIRALTGTYATELVDGELRIVPGRRLALDHAVSLPTLHGARIGGIPTDPAGFIPIDEHARVAGVERVWAAGDATSFPVKQGGIAAQQADAAAEDIAARLGAELEPARFRPVLSGVLLTGERPAHLQAPLQGGEGEPAGPSPAPLWWPPGKIAGRHLAPFLAARTSLDLGGAPASGTPVEVALDHEALSGGR